MTTTNLYPQWIENKPKNRESICYLVSGYGMIYFGESNDPLNRFRSTIKENKWATTFLWVNLHQFGIFDSSTRKHLEALMIFSASENIAHWENEIRLSNKKYIRTMGEFAQKRFHHTYLVQMLLSNFLNYVRLNPDPRGNFKRESKIVQNTRRTHKVRIATFQRIQFKLKGLDRVGKSVKCLEMKLQPCSEELQT